VEEAEADLSASISEENNVEVTEPVNEEIAEENGFDLSALIVEENDGSDLTAPVVE
jgi:hypothetical protein